MKRIALMFFIIIVLMGCSNHEEIPNENKRLKEESESSLKKMNEENREQALKESLNLTFKLLSAMGDKDYDFIESNSSTSVKVSREQNMIIVNNGENFYEVALQSKMELGDLEFRGYELKDAKHLKLMMAVMFNQDIKGSEGHAALYFDYIRSDDDRWLLDGFLTN